MKKTLALIVALIAAVALAACGDKADVASDNISKAADNFEVFRSIHFVNGITDKELLRIEGLCNIADEGSQLEVTCKNGEDDYTKQFLGLSDNMTYFVEQPVGIDVSEERYRVTWKPEQIIPDVNESSSPAP